MAQLQNAWHRFRGPRWVATTARAVLTAPVFVILMVSASCVRSKDNSKLDSRVEATSPHATPATSGLPTSESADWVRLYKPESAFNGYTLAFYRRRTPILMDMNGRILHAWPEARTRSRIRLLEDGTLLALTLDGGVAEYSWNGDLLWKHKPQKGFAHHDVIRLANGNTMLIVRARGLPADVIMEIDRDGRVVWEWRSGVQLAQQIQEKGTAAGDSTHINSVQEIPDNDWFRQGDDRFRPGNLLVSARNLDLVVLIDRQTGAVVWSFDTDLDRQHEALMIGPGMPGHGNIIVFNNRYRSFHGDRRSRVIEVDPRDFSVVWQYESDGFYSPTSAIEQPLPNGNVLITSSRGGRAFEVTRQGKTVWEWTPPYDPLRPRRYAYDHSPQLASLGSPAEELVEPPEGYRHVDRDVYRFSRRGSRRKLMLDGKKRTVLESNHDCRILTLPTEATIQLGYGLDHRRISRSGRTELEAEFRLRLHPEGTGQDVQLFQDRLDFSDPAWKSASVDLRPYEHQRVQICLDIEGAEDSSDDSEGKLAYWANPRIGPSPTSDRSREAGSDPFEALTDEEIRTTKEQLKALGYID